MTTGRIKNFIGLIGMFLLLFACSNDDEGKDMGDHASIFIDSDIYHEAESDDFHLEEARITGDSLEVRIRYGGGCGEVKLRLAGMEEVLDSDPPRRKIRLLLEDNDPCEAFIAETFYFKLSAFQIAGSSRTGLLLSDWDGSLLYEY